MKPCHDLTLSAMFKRIAYDASEQAIGDTHEMMNRLGECPTEEYSEKLADDLLKYYEDELRQKERLHSQYPLDPEVLFLNRWDNWENIQQIKSIIEILKTNTMTTHDNTLLFIRQLMSGIKISIECDIAFGKIDSAESMLDYLDKVIKINPTAPFADELLKWVTEKTEQIDNIKSDKDESDRVNRNVEASEGMER